MCAQKGKREKKTSLDRQASAKLEKESDSEKMQLIPFRAFTWNFPPTQPASGRAKGWGERGLTSWLV